MTDWTQLGLAGATLGILLLVVKFFMDYIKESRKESKELTEKFITMSEENIKTHLQLNNTIEANTKVTLESVNQSKLSSDKLTELVLKIATK